MQERTLRNAKRELKEEPYLASYQQYELMQKQSKPSLQDTNIYAETIEQLMDKLQDYVGANGCYMPYTMAVELDLPIESLKELEIVDTPGVNDPIASRGARITEFLNQCDAVFMVSPAGDFMSEQDVSFLGRITKGSGVTYASIVASKTDDELFGSMKEKSTNPAEVFDLLAKDLTEQARSILDRQKNKTIPKEVIDLFKENGVICSSGISYNLFTQFHNQQLWDSGMQTV